MWFRLFGTLWQEGLQEDFRKIVQTPDGGFISAGSILYDPPGSGSIQHSGHIIKIDGNGNQEWYQTVIGYEVGHIISSSDGNYILSARKASGSHVWKINSSGEEIWSHVHDLGDYTNLVKVIETPDEHLIIAGMVGSGSPTEMGDIFLRKLSPDGQEILFTETYSKPNLHEKVSELRMTPDGGFAISGTEVPSGNPLTPYNTKAFLIKTNENGEELWRRKYGKQVDQFYAVNYAMKVTSDGGFILSGTDDHLIGGHQMHLVKTDVGGWLRARFLKGNVFNDLDVSCSPTPGETGMYNWIVSAYGENEFHTNTDEFGNYFMEVDSGAYNVAVNYPSAYWEACENPIMTEVFSAFDTTTVDFPIQAKFDCPFLTVNIGTPFLRWCSNNYYTIHYCNNGTIAATDAYVELSLDEYLTLNNSGVPVSSQNGNTYTFNVGNVDVGECDYFVLETELSCDEEIQGFTHCTEAHIYPDSLCGDLNANWDGSSIEVEGICQGDSITFIITNIGDSDMSEPGDFLIVEDQIMMMQGTFDLTSGESTYVTFLTEGATYRMEADQSIGHPGNNMPAAIIEGCGTSPFSLGLVNTFSLNDFDNYLDIDCVQNISSFDPNDKRGIPFGVGEDHFIRPGTDIDYMIRFQNTGTDTAFQVVLLDTLSNELNDASIRLGASSHPYEFNLDGQGIMKFSFDNIMLPDSNVNEVASHGFVKFKISHKEDIPLGTQIFNLAGIYFDANSVVLTNTTLHTVDENFIEVSLEDNFATNPTTNTLNLFPNPTSDYVMFRMENKISNGKIIVSDATGKLIRSAKFTGDQFKLDANEFAKGIYFFQILDQEAQLFSGKIVVH